MDFSPHSKQLLAMAHPDLQKIMEAAILRTNFCILESFRSPAQQERDFQRGVTHAHAYQSPHNFLPSLAVDIAPLPIDWQNLAAFHNLSNVVTDCAARLHIHITWGGTFRHLVDMPHFELTAWRDLAKGMQHGDGT